MLQSWAHPSLSMCSQCVAGSVDSPTPSAWIDALRPTRTSPLLSTSALTYGYSVAMPESGARARVAALLRGEARGRPSVGAMLGTFAALAVPMLLLAAIAVYAVLSEDVAVEGQADAQRAAETADSVRDEVAVALAGVAADVRMLTALDRDKAVLESMALALLRTRPHVHQVRVLDAEGVETLRFQREAGEPIRVPDDALQDKSHRDYFKAARRLGPGAVYVSRMDLNMEHGAIERPLRPTIRFAARLAGGGVIVINLDTSDLLRGIRVGHSFPIWVCDGAGNFLIGPSEDHDFAFLLQKERAIGLGDILPELWGVARRSDQGSYATRGERYGFAAHQPNVGRGHVAPEARLVTVVQWPNRVPTVLSEASEHKALLLWMALAILLVAAALAYQVAMRGVVQRRSASRGELAMALLDEAPDAVLICDAKGSILYANYASERVLDASRASLIGTSAQPHFVLPGDPSVHLPDDFGSAQMAESLQRPWVRAGDPDYKLSVAVRPVSVEGATLYLLFARDITHEERTLSLVETNRRLDETNERLVRINDDLESFSYTLAHDLRTPIRAMSAAVGMLAELALPEEATPLLERARNASQRLSALVDGTLALSRVGRTAMSPVETELSTLVAGVRSELDAEYPHRQVLWEVAPDLRATVDRRLATELLRQLARNAYRATEAEDEPSVQVGRTADGEFFVRDNGVGIDMADNNQLFEPFLAHGDVESEVGGVGLAMAQKIVVRHGGRMRVESAVGQGATFFFTLPQRDVGQW